MVDVLSGKDDGPLAGWAIAMCHGQVLLGKKDPAYVLLRPVYSLSCAMQMVQQSPRHPPQLMTMRQVTPFLTYPSLSTQGLPLPSDAIVIGVESLTKKERHQLAQNVEACEQMVAAMTAEDDGIVLAPAGARLP